MSNNPETGNKETKETEKSYTQTEVQELVKGLQSKNSELLGEVKGLKTKLKEFDGVDLTAFKEWQQKANDEAEKELIKKGQFEELFNQRIARLNQAHKAEIDAITKKAVMFAERALQDGIRQVATGENLHATAIDDAIMRAKTVFEIDDDGNIAPKDKMLGKDGKPLTVKEWFSEMKKTAPHWFKAPSGGGSNSVSGSGNNTTAGKWGGNIADRINVIRSKFPDLPPK